MLSVPLTLSALSSGACCAHILPQVYRRARRELGEILSAFEFLDRQALDLTKQHLESVKDPLPSTETPFYLVVETSGSNAEHDMAKLEVKRCCWQNPSCWIALKGHLHASHM